MTFNPLSWSLPDIPMLKSFGQQLADFNQPYTAKNIFEQLIQRVQNFEAMLDQEHEVGMRLVSFGKSTEFSVARIGCLNPSLLWFEGTLSDGSAVELVQHVSQVNFLLIKLKRQSPLEPRCPIGFCTDPSLAANTPVEPPDAASSNPVPVKTDAPHPAET